MKVGRSNYLSTFFLPSKNYYEGVFMDKLRRNSTYVPFSPLLH